MTTLIDDPLSACLLWLAQHHGKGTSRDALVSGLALVEGRLTPALFEKAAARAGLTSGLIRVPLLRIDPSLLPCIVLLHGNRAVVLEAFNADSQLVIRVPELDMAAQSISVKALSEQYAGFTLYCQKQFVPEPKEHQGTQPAALKEHWFWEVIKHNRRIYRDVLIAALFINLFALVMPLFVMNVYDRVVPNQAVDTLWVLAAGAFIVVGADLILRILRSWFVELAAQRADVKLSSRIMERILGMRLEHAPRSIGAFAANVNAFESVRAFIGSLVVCVLIDLPFFLVFILIIAVISPLMAVPVLVGALLVMGYALSVQNQMRKLSEVSSQASAQRNAGLIESLSCAATFKSFNATGVAQGKWEQATQFLSACSGKQRLLSGSVSSGAAWVQNVVSVALLIVGVYLVIGGHMSQGAWIAAYMLPSRALAPVSQTAGLLSHYYQSATALQSLETIMSTAQERAPEKTVLSRASWRGEIELRNVSFTYPDEKKPALSNVSLKIKAGERIGILGCVGSGKSTLEKLIMGLYQPSSGEVLIDGVNLQQLDIAELRRHIGYLPQDIQLITGSVYDNVTLGTDHPNPKRLYEAIHIAGLTRLVGDHADGLGMPVGEGGMRLSGGQRQAIAVARAAMTQSCMLLLDEPTSSMDSQLEAHVSAALGQFSQDKTLLLITHRAGLLHLVERLIVLDGGCVIADGSKEAVLSALQQGALQRASA